MEFNFSLPFPPSVNHTWMRGAGKRLYSNPKVKAFHGDASLLISEFRKKILDLLKYDFFAEPLKEKLGVKIVLHEKDARRRDIDNYTKSIFDAITKNQLWLDDSQVDELVVTRGERSKENPRVDIKIWTLE